MEGSLDSVVTFLAVMAALSAATKGLTDVVLQFMPRLSVPIAVAENDFQASRDERARQLAIQWMAGFIGFALAFMAGINPLGLLLPGSAEAAESQKPVWELWIRSQLWLRVVNAAVAGVLVSYGGPFFNEALGVLRNYKQDLEKNWPKVMRAPGAAGAADVSRSTKTPGTRTTTPSK